MRIINLQLNHMRHVLGYQLSSMTFTWQYEASFDEVIQSETVKIYQGEKQVYETNDADRFGTHVSIDLQPCTQYTWIVETTLQNQQIVTSDPQLFETGKCDQLWRGQWITTVHQKEPRHPVFTKQFSAHKPVTSARLYITGLGLFETRLNDQEITDEKLLPYCTDYDEWLQVFTFDITRQIQKDNVIEVMLGNGWYRGRFGFNAANTDPAYGDEWKLCCEIHLVYEDGETDVICSDESWQVRRSNILFSNIYDGEIVDDTLDEMPLEPVVLTTCNIPLYDRLSTPVKQRETFHPKKIITPKNEQIFDVGQNLAGTFSLHVHGQKGDRIVLQFTECLQDECFYRDNLRSAKAQYTYISDGSDRWITPHFTFYGFRYFKVEGVDCQEEDVIVYALYSEIPERSSLVTGNEKVNQLLSNCRWGMKSNYLDVPTDCPQRDERMGWTGDAQVFTPTALYLSDVYAFMNKYLFDMAKIQEAHDGLVPFTVPSFHIYQAACVWSDATTLIPTYMYRFDGDTKILEDHYPAMKQWVEYIRKVDGEDRNWRKQFHFGDWLALDGQKSSEAVAGRTDEGFIAEVYYRKSALLTAETAHILGYEQDEMEYRVLAKEIEKNIYDSYYTPDGRCAVMTMTGQILSIQEKLGSLQTAKELLAKLLNLNMGKLETGFVGTPLLCPTLSQIGMSKQAYDLLLNEECPGWLFEVNLGATTVWERWNSLDENGHITGIGMNSLNHYSYGSITEWMYGYMAGIRAKKPGFKEALIAFETDYRIGHVDCVYHSAAGTYEVHWKIVDRYHIQASWTVPYDCRAEVILPDYKKSCGGAVLENGTGMFTQGTYTCTYETNMPTDETVTLETVVKEALKHEAVKEYLEAIPLFQQSEYSFLEQPLRTALMACSYTEEQLQEAERQILEMQ